jgi:WD40 repeat protein
MGDGDFECVAVLQEHSQDVKFVKWHPNEDVLVSCSYDDTIRIWTDQDDDDWSCSQVLQGHSSTVWSVDFDKTGQYLASVSDDLSLKIWKRTQQGKYELHLNHPNLHTRTIYSVAFNYPMIATCGADNSICVSELVESVPDNLEEMLIEDGSLPKSRLNLRLIERIENAHGDRDVNHVSWCKVDGFTNYLASCGDDGNINVWTF